MNFESWLHGWEAHMFDTVAAMFLGSQHEDKANPGKEAEYSEQFGLENALQQFTVWRQLKLI